MSERRPDLAPVGSPAGRERRSNLAFVGWASGLFLVGSVAMVLICRHVTGGRVIYVVDDAAIHLSVAQNLLRHGTWGVQPGVYQSASSSPLWGVLLAGAMWITRTRDVLPWLLNVMAGLWLIWAVGSRQTVLKPHRRAPLAIAATAGLVTVVLFMPALTMVGMEHLLHAAMGVQLLAWIHDRALGRATRVPTWAPYLLATLAVLTRFETMWVVAGLGLGYLIDGAIKHRALSERLPTVVGLGLAVGAPVAAYAVFNRAMGQGFLPNSVLAKTVVSNAAISITPQDILNHLTTDPMLAVVLIMAIAYLALAATGERAQSIVPAVTVIVAVVVHSVFAQYGYWERYQAYLVALGVYFLFSAARELLPDRTTALAVLALAALLVTPVKWALLVQTPKGTDNTYSQRYQAALFVAREYDSQAIATGELGYISLLHRGPVVDLLGLGNYQVLQHRKEGTDDAAFYAQEARRNGVDIATVYSGALAGRTPGTWFLVADWRLHGTPISTLREPYQFWATSPGAATALRAALAANLVRLPPHVSQYDNTCLDTELAQARGGPPADQCLTRTLTRNRA
ncbi:MAG: hypothetical protein M3N98_12460 [Actinomycetota bacterium]|nr:hypothetical protein [Actinomycetota bacterium]